MALVSAQRMLARVLSGVPLGRRATASSEEAVPGTFGDAPETPFAPSGYEAAEWILLLDSVGCVLQADRAQVPNDHRLGEVLERLRKSASIVDLHPTVFDVVDAARRLGTSGSRLALIPDLLSQPFPVRLAVTALEEGRGRYRAELSSLVQGPTLARTVAAGATHSELLMLSLADASERAQSITTVASDVLPTLCEMFGADGCLVYESVGDADDLQLLATAGRLPQKPAQSVRIGGGLDRQARRRGPFDADGLRVGSPEWFGWHPEPKRSLLFARRMSPKTDQTSQVVAFVRDKNARTMVPAASARVSLELVTERLAALSSAGALTSMAADLETAYTVTKAISQSLDVDSTFHEIALSAARAVKGSSCLLFELAPTLTELVVVASSDADGSALRGLRFKFASAEEALAALTQRTAIVVQDLRGDYGVDTQLGEALTMRSALFVPMIVQSAPIGSLLLYSKEVEREYAPGDLRMVEHIADQAASAVENARLYRDLRLSESKIRSLLHKVSLMREQQRSALATIVHDEITQSMVGAIYELESVVEELDVDHSQSVGKVLVALRDATRRSREVIASLRSPVLDELGLPHALRSLAGDFHAETGIRCQVECSGTRELPDTVESSLYRIAREALVNVRKHAQARSVRVIFACERGEARLEVLDDGKGLSQQEARDSLEHFGVLMMQELAAACGGTCIVGPGRKSGVSVLATIPLSALPPPEADELP